MRVLVAYAGNHGSTAEIAQSIADGVRHGLGRPDTRADDLAFVPPAVSVWSVEDAPEPGGSDAVILGSAVKLERRDLHVAEKAVVVALRTPDGDFRDWGAIAAWGHGIAASLTAGARA